jgi:hypothetical protein
MHAVIDVNEQGAIKTLAKMEQASWPHSRILWSLSYAEELIRTP